eukprot:CAMPEP_0117077586 /NCGR_PEP_ID=MMETSP0472-20121206/54701_1 /TAXON_ID=693140 ORGANISM="Tiarina fusus, Strain LIS" /NCGR_SAMPLE_ID=MMETSP0472 /ASSEMBLY_ACC=CAM_ASM_000603 /LENGTH=230 /DNA_ID=CAMNT_0004803973 /DNA_START=1 /DNA_END=693 /DNA_ORIENTATION=+
MAWAWLSGNNHKGRYTRASYGSIAVQAILKPGTYKAVLARRGNHPHGGPYAVIAESEHFETRFNACPARRELERLSKDDYYFEEQEDFEEQEEPKEKDDTCDANLVVDQTEYTVGDDIALHLFSDASSCEGHLASPDSFVGIYQADIAVDEIWGDANYETFLWTCGSQSCHSSNVVNEFVFGRETLMDAWHLPEGRYKAHLVVPNGRRFRSVAQSDVFEVSEALTSQVSS